ncbi:LADA_0A05314g1_1 [Lachancea dasiensis]|uniref:LADA_0A05314g1_1 n=1 Tax=Lachancea dasiensis TaxID=1072105 RepID=A0A1G4IPB9_9SACH|nr:LADA_0A05314g1_1 [Lachancea dasiensis]
MKFAEHLRESAVPEWIDKYIDYKTGKKKLKACRKTIAASKILVNNVPAINTPRSPPSNEDARYCKHNDYTDAQKYFVKEFVEKWVIDQELEKCNDFYLWETNQCGKRFDTLQDQISRYKVHKEQLENIDRGQKQVTLNSYGALEDANSRPMFQFNNSWSSHLSRTLQDLELMPSLPSFAPFKRLFGQLDRKSEPVVGKGETFTPAKLSNNQITQRLSDALIEEYLLIQLIKNYREVNVTGFRKIVKKFDKTCSTAELPHFMEYAKATFPLFHDADASANAMAQNLRDTVMIRPPANLDSHLRATDPLIMWEQHITTWYTDILATSSKDRKRKSARLKNLSLEYSLSERKIHRFNRAILQMFAGGLFTGASLILVAYTLFVGFTASPISNLHRLHIPLWGGWYMVFLMIFLYLVDCYVWHKNNINYRFIMFGEMHSRHGAVLFNNDFSTTKIPLLYYFASVLSFPLTVLSVLSFHAGKLSPYSIIWIVMIVCLFFLPMFHRYKFGSIPYWDKLSTSVKWLTVTFIRLIFSGCFPVQFGDFFMGDIFASLTYSMADVALFFCIYSNTPDGLCGSSHSKSMGALSCLPNFWRFLQCLRRFADSGDWFPHLLNGFKYAMGICYNASLCAYRLSFTSNRRGIFITFGTVYAIIASLWDVVMDWSLLQRNSRNWLLRDDLYLAGRKNWKTGAYSRSRKMVYYAAMIANVIIRFEWIVYAVAPKTIQQSAITSFILAALEVCRRFVWVIFRVENEHVANVHLFKVSGEISLPFPSTLSSGSEADVASIASGRYSMSELSYPELPHAAYRRSATLRESHSSEIFKTFSKSIPWAHAKDFQRPQGRPDQEDKGEESDASESEVDSTV